ncbi:zinc-binding dehydrogenase [Chloroflexota bacterium]
MNGKEWSAVLEDKERIVLTEFPLPEIGPDEGLLKVDMVGVCGGDPREYHCTSPVKRELPIILGHEVFGHIAEVGEVASARWGVKKGDRVVNGSSDPCGHCQYCQAGRSKWCRNRLGWSVPSNRPPHIWGGYGEYMYLPPGTGVYRISDDLPPEAAVLINAVIANGIQWVRIIGGASIGDTVVIQGAGAQGLAATIAAKESGASPIIVTGLSADKQGFELAKKFGADYTIDVQKEDVVESVKEISEGMMADLVVEATGSASAIATSVDLVTKGGTMVLAGSAGPVPIITSKLTQNQIRLQGVFTNGKEAMLAAIKLVESRKYPVEEMITHKFSLQQAEEALKVTGGEIPSVSSIRAVIVP